jgi:DNA-binding CsgD family transcriptional regulator
MAQFAACYDEVDLEVEEQRILAAFTRRLIEIAALSRSEIESFSSKNVLNMLRQPAILLDLEGCVVGANVAAVAIFSNDLRIKDRRILIRDIEARAKLRAFTDQLDGSPLHLSPPIDPVIVPRQDKLPVLLRIWPIDAAARWPTPAVRALLTLNALGPKPGPPAPILAKTFGLTPSEAKLACIIARGAGPEIAALELKISRETARNQLKSVFAKTGTHRQSELVALLLQVH